MISVSYLQSAVRTFCLDGWLFSGFHHRDPLAEEILGVTLSDPATRRWFYIVFAENREPLKIVHAIEPNILAHLPGTTGYYATENQLVQILARLRNRRIAVHCDLHIPVFSLLDAGTFQLLRHCGIRTESASPLILAVKGILQPVQQESHCEAAKKLYKITARTWEFIAGFCRNNRRISEKDVQDFILEEFEKEQMITDHAPITAFARHTADPHYSDADSACILHEGDPVQLDIWAKNPGGIYADISWFGIYAKKAPLPVQRTFAAATGARDSVVRWLAAELAAGRFPTGADADIHARNYLENAGVLSAVKHRTGHAIDTECHGYGVNLDSVEFPDFRNFREGSLFSVEPGVYFAEYGIRTEINVLIKDGKPVVTGESPLQQEIVTFC